MTQRASLLRAILLAAVAIPSAACGDSSSSDTASTSPQGGNGGSSSGGSSSGGSSSGGTSSGGTDVGGSSSGGSGGTSSGGADAGGTSSGGTSSGGTSSGGTSSGGTSSGGTSSGGTDAGGTSSGGTGGTASGGSGGASGGTGGTAGAAGSASFLPCENPAAIEVGGKPTGYEVCSSGAIHRKEAIECPSLLPRPDACAQADQGGNCKVDADCTEAPNGFCRGSEGGFEAPGCYCQYGCTKDADCGAGSVCLCGEPVGRCVSATCRSDQDCGGGMCNSYGLDQVCYTFGFACQSPADTCGGNNDCTAPEYCLPEGDHRICKQDQPCAIGRPLMIEEGWRFAGLVRRSDW